MHLITPICAPTWTTIEWLTTATVGVRLRERLFQLLNLESKSPSSRWAGLTSGDPSPKFDAINILPHVRQPVLMLNGHCDFFFPEQTTQVPFYNLLGSRKDQKKRLVYETGHAIPHNELIKETLNWLDEYLGPTDSHSAIRH